VRLTAGTSPADQKDSMADHLAGLPAMSRPLDLYPYGRYHDCSRCFFLVLLQRQRPRRNRLTAIMEVRWTFTASTRKPTLRMNLHRAKGICRMDN
jgi:hypothetical protein